MRTQETKKGWPFVREGEDQKLETSCLSVLEGAHVRGSFGLGSGDLGGITDDEGSILVEQPKRGALFRKW